MILLCGPDNGKRSEQVPSVLICEFRESKDLQIPNAGTCWKSCLCIIQQGYGAMSGATLCRI